MNQDIKDLLSYYNRQPDPIMIKVSFSLLAGLEEEKQKEVIDWILNHVPKKSGLDIPMLKNAMREVGATSPQGEERPRHWICDCCGTTFQRVTISHEELRRQGIHDYCPRCGLAPSETDNANTYAERADGRLSEWYTRMKKEITASRLIPGARPRYDPKSDDAFDAEQKRLKIERMKTETRAEVSSIAQSKRVAL